jgi:hypothetical protein
MKRNIRRTTLPIVFFATLLLSLAVVASAEDEGTCSTAGAAGEFGHTLTGTLILPTGPVPFAAAGRTTFDADGHFSGTQDSSVGGRVSKDTIKGTFTVNSDCTGTLTTGIFDQSGNLLRTATWATVFVDKGREIRAIITSLVLLDGTRVPSVVTLNGKKQFRGRGNQQ